MKKIENYFDYAATTPVAESVIAAMMPYFLEKFANPSSGTSFSQTVYADMLAARQTIKHHFNAPEGSEVIFTGSSTEAANIVLKSRILRSWSENRNDPGTVLISATEHSAVRNTVKTMAEQGFCRMKVIPVDEMATVKMDALSAELTNVVAEKTILVSIIGANNELGTIQPVTEISRCCHAAGVPFHCDATQLVAHSLLDLSDVEIDFLTVSGHKLYAPKGVGAIVTNRADLLQSMTQGGSQEMGLRAGTENVPYVIGIAEAYRLLGAEADERFAFERELRDLIIGRVLNEIPDTVLTGHPVKRLAHHASFSFRNVDSLLLQSALDQRGFQVSIGSACRSNQIRGQQQLVEIGLGKEWINGGLRVTVGRFTTMESAHALVNVMKETVAAIRRIS